jgi:hypothetical protein
MVKGEDGFQSLKEPIKEDAIDRLRMSIKEKINILPT